MVIKRFVVGFTCLLLCLNSFSQQKYWVFFTDKDTAGFVPSGIFDEKVSRRCSDHRRTDYTDFPVKGAYVREIAKNVISTGYESRWLNAVAVTAGKSQIRKLKHLPFVHSVEPMNYLISEPFSLSESDSLDYIDSFVLESQISMLQGEYFARHGINGKGIRIAVFDNGFGGLPENPVLKRLVDNHQIIKTYDFQHRNEFVYAHGNHGTAVLSCIAGTYGNKPMGLASGAEFLLARTEIRPEKHIEEEYWLAAMEWADQNGADIISSSVGYTSKLYPVEAMNGRTSIIAKAANIAASKGILVINAMGNDGDKRWEVLCTPADADSVLSVGGVNPFSGYHISFSSFGPTSDMRLKPNVSAPGMALAATKNKISRVYGTSFSAPLIAGFAACVWQLNHTKNNMEIFRMIEQSAHLFPYYDYAHGYGIPQASWFFEKNETVPDLLHLATENDSLKVTIKEPGKVTYGPYDYLYYHIAKGGILKKYAVVKVERKDVLSIGLNSLMKGDTIRFFYRKNIKSFIK